MITNSSLYRLQDLRSNLSHLQTVHQQLITWKEKNSITNFDRITLYGMNGELRIVLPQHKMPFNIHNEIENLIADAIADLQNEINLITQNL